LPFLLAEIGPPILQMNQTYPIFAIESARSYEAGVLGGDEAKTTLAMTNAGEAIGAGILNDYLEVGEWPDRPELLVLAGKGLNAGDAFVACFYLWQRLPGQRVSIVLTEDKSCLNPLAAKALAQLSDSMGENLQTLSIEEYLQTEPCTLDVVLDGIYGHGFHPPLQEAVAELLSHVNNRTDIHLRVAVDLPSGLCEDMTNEPFHADITYVPGVAKSPCFDDENKKWVGRIRFLEIEPFFDQRSTDDNCAHLVSPSSYRSLNRIRPAQSDKRDYGHCLVLSGSSQLPGASLMSGMGALQSGAGLVTILTPSTVSTQIAGALPEAMWRPLPVTMEGGLEVETVRITSRAATRANAILIGPGLVLDKSTLFVLCRVIREVHLPMVLDASALTQDVVAAVLGRPFSAGPVILTPHPGEFARMNGVKKMEIDDHTLINFSRKYRAVTVLKGSPTRICDGERVFHAPVGGPVLARGGAGDILAGIMTTLLAQSPDDPLSAAIQAVTWHGAAADSLARERGAIGVKTTEMLPHLAKVLRP
jgi:hydroxyethylthiazole kinase-like uncharacterized protein yjeF